MGHETVSVVVVPSPESLTQINLIILSYFHSILRTLFRWETHYSVARREAACVDVVQ